MFWIVLLCLAKPQKSTRPFREHFFCSFFGASFGPIPGLFMELWSWRQPWRCWLISALCSIAFLMEGQKTGNPQNQKWDPNTFSIARNPGIGCTLVKSMFLFFLPSIFGRGRSTKLDLRLCSENPTWQVGTRVIQVGWACPKIEDLQKDAKDVGRTTIDSRPKANGCELSRSSDGSCLVMRGRSLKTQGSVRLLGGPAVCF